MHPLLVFAGQYGPNIASWLLAHGGELGDASARVIRPVMAAITDPTASVDRIGSALVAQQNGQREVIGLLHQHTAKLDGIATAVDGIGQSVGEINRSIGVLTSLSMVGLGLSALSQIHIAFQFARLTERLNRLEAEVQEIKGMMHADFRGALNAGLTQMEMGLGRQADSPALAAALFHQAINNLTTSTAKYTELLNGGVGSGNVQTRWMLARHLTVSVLGEVAIYTQLRETGLAVGSLNATLLPLRQHARSVFERTVAAKPTTFLMPALAEHGITLEVVAELYRQAAHSGVIEAGNRATAGDLFETLRDRLIGAMDPWFFKSSKVWRLRAEFTEAATAIEEVNRLQGLALAIGHCERAGQDYLTLVEGILKEIAARQPAEGTCFATFPATTD